MDDVSVLESDLHHVLAHPGDQARLGAVIERICSPSAEVAWRAAEHEYGRLIVLAGLARCATGGGDPLEDLLAAVDRYAEGSIYYTGRILPRIRIVLSLLAQATREGRLEPLVEAADHVSQGWAGYRDSAFPGSFQRLAGHLGLAAGDGDFRLTSYTAWQSALSRAANHDVEEALRLFSVSLERYHRYGYIGDATWLHTDIVLAQLLVGRLEAARRTHEEQRRFLEGLATAAPGVHGSGEGGDGAVAIGVVRSGDYETFVESTSMSPDALSPTDVAALRRYVATSQRLIDFVAYGRRVDFEAALDLFTFGWTSYPSTPYPGIFSHLARSVARTAPEADYLNPYLTAYHQWQAMLSSVKLPVDARRLWTMTVEIRERLQRVGFLDEAALVVLDSAMLRLLVLGTDGVADLLAVHRAELRSRLPGLFGDVTAALGAVNAGTDGRHLTPFLAHRAAYPVPDFIPALSVCVSAGPGGAPAASGLEVTLLGDALSVNGVTLYPVCPPGLRDVIRVLGRELTGAQQRQEPVRLLGAGELAERVGKSPASLAQMIRRFRAVCEEQMTKATGQVLPRDAIIQGRPGYRFNPLYVTRVVLASFDRGEAVEGART